MRMLLPRCFGEFWAGYDTGDDRKKALDAELADYMTKNNLTPQQLHANMVACRQLSESTAPDNVDNRRNH